MTTDQQAISQRLQAIEDRQARIAEDQQRNKRKLEALKQEHSEIDGRITQLENTK